MKIRSPEPEAVQRLVGVTVGFSEMLEPLLRIRRVEKILVHTQRVRIRIEAMPIRFYFVDRGHFAYPLAGKIRSARPVTTGTKVLIDRLSFCDERGVNCIGIRRRPCIEQPIRGSFNRETS